MFLQCAYVSILRAEKENGYADVASILGPAFVWERSANVPDLAYRSRSASCAANHQA